MRINNNMSAVITNNQLLGNEQSLADVMEKLSSGLSINHASDNPSGIAIAGKMQAQIEGVDQASTNGQDGISVLQTAEGALKEVTDMIQRMRELSIQAANGTNADSEKASIQMEISSLLEEIDRISDTTHFNGINLLDGSLDDRTYGDHCTRIQTSNTVAPGTYQMIVKQAATFASVESQMGAVTNMTQDVQTTYLNGELSSSTETDATFAASAAFTDFIDNTNWTVVKHQYIQTKNGDGSITTTDNVGTYTGSGLAISGTISINGYEAELEQGMSGEEVYEAIRNAAEKGNAKISDKTEKLTISSNKYGSDASLEIIVSSTALAQALGFDGNGTPVDSSTAIRMTDSGSNPTIVLLRDGDAIVGGDGNVYDANSDFGKQATIRFEDGNKVIITDTNDFEISCLLTAGFSEQTDNSTGIQGLISLNVTDIGSLTLHIGANENQEMDVRIRSVSCDYMYIDDLDVTKIDGPEDAIRALDGALEYVTSLRAQLGAYENRLDHTTKSLDETSENMSSAISRIEDADMATTMVEYTKYTVLQQAGTSALAQANELPQLALQLLQ